MKHISLLLLGVFALSGCGLSKQARQERAYAKYVNRSSNLRQKQQVKFRSGKPQMPINPMPSEPMVSTSSGPEAATSPGSP